MKLSIVSYFDAQSTKTIRDLQHALSDLTGSHAALNSWQPHVTIGDGVELTNEELAQLESELVQLATHSHAFTLTLRGFDSYTNWKPGVGQTGTPYVLYIHVILNPAFLKLVQHVSHATQGKKIWYTMPKPYAPHITLAFRDLNEAGYTRGMDYLRSQSLNQHVTIDHIALVVTQAESNRELKRIMLRGLSR